MLARPSPGLAFRPAPVQAPRSRKTKAAHVGVDVPSTGPADVALPTCKRGGKRSRDLIPVGNKLLEEFSSATEDSSYFTGKDVRNQRRVVERVLSEVNAAAAGAVDDPAQHVLLQMLAKGVHCMLEIIRICKAPGFRSAECVQVPRYCSPRHLIVRFQPVGACIRLSRYDF